MPRPPPHPRSAKDRVKRLRTGPARGSVGGLVEWFFASLVWLIVIAFGLSVLAHLIFAAVLQLL